MQKNHSIVVVQRCAEKALQEKDAHLKHLSPKKAKIMKKGRGGSTHFPSIRIKLILHNDVGQKICTAGCICCQSLKLLAHKIMIISKTVQDNHRFKFNSEDKKGAFNLCDRIYR